MLSFIKRFSTLVIGAGLVLSMSTANALEVATENGKEVYKLKLHHLLSDKSPAHKYMLQPMADRIAKETDGRVQIEIFPAMTLGGRPQDLIHQVRRGEVDLVWTVNGYTAGLFPRSEVFELPFIHTNDTTATNLAMWEMHDKYLAPEYQSVHVLYTFVHPGQAIHMVDKEVRSPADMAGLKMRIPTRTGAWIIEALGANPVGMPVPQLPESLSKKVVDGAFIPWEIIPPLKLDQLTDYQIEGHNKTRFGTTTFQVSMNKETWKGLPKDVQDIITKMTNSEEWVRWVADQWIRGDEEGIAFAVKNGNKHVQLTEAETEAFRKTLEPVINRWIVDVQSKGINGAELVKVARETIAKYSK
jgi:TRAP-type C4-dicarboxylate transport system substrate-binding protein